MPSKCLQIKSLLLWCMAGNVIALYLHPKPLEKFLNLLWFSLQDSWIDTTLVTDDVCIGLLMGISLLLCPKCRSFTACDLLLTCGIVTVQVIFSDEAEDKAWRIFEDKSLEEKY